MTEFFAQPDDLGEIKSSELHTSMGERLGAQFGEAFFGASRTLVRGREYADAESGQESLGSQIQRLQNGEDLNDVVSKPQPPAELPIADAKARVKQEGLEGRFKLPDQPTIKQPVLDLMIDHAHERQQYDAAVTRGPQGFIPGALGMATEIGAGIIDPVNVAAFSIPVMGEARMGMMIARAGESLAARAGVKAGIGAAQGAVGSAALVPGDWWLHTKDGVDYTMTDALHSVVMGAGMGGAFHAAIGAFGDLRARGRGAPLPGSLEDLRARALGGDTHAADLVERLGGSRMTPENGPADALGTPPAGEAPAGEEVPGISPAAEAPAAAAPAEALPRIEELTPGHPAEVLADLPPQAREDVLRSSIADVVNGNAVRAGEMLQEAGKADPRIAESLDAGRDAALAHAQELSPAGREVFEDMRGQLRRAGMDDAEAHANAAIVAARYEARAARLEGAGGTAADLYRAEGITVRRHTPAELLADELGRRYDQGKLDDKQLDMFRDAVQHLPKAEPEEDPAAAFDRMHAAYYTPERLARMKTEFVAPGPPREMQIAEPHIIEMMRNGASSAEINRALALSRAERDARRSEGALQWHRSFGQARRRTGLEGQQDMFGGERASDAELAQRRADEALKPKVAQKPMDEGLFGDTSLQSDLVDRAKQPRELFQSGPTVPTFYSAVSRAVQSARLDRGTPEQWLATIRNTPGVKGEELKWLGIEDWLKQQGGKVSRADVDAYVRANSIEVHEVTKGESAPRDVVEAAMNAENEFQTYSTWLARKYDLNPLQNLAMFRTLKRMEQPEVDRYEQLQSSWLRAKEARDAQEGKTKFASYTLPGGENYRELLLTLPEKPGERGPKGWGDSLGGTSDSANFMSSHFDEPNILAHVRFNDRTIDGKKTLFIEEVQSDWHQQGKRKGYKSDEPLPQPRNWVTFLAEKGYTREQALAMWDRRSAPEDVALHNEHFHETEQRAMAMAERANAVPDAPFKTTWPELAFKRMIRHAAENGYDRIAWTKGETQAERYDLSKHVSRIRYVDNNHLTAWDRNGNEVMSKSGVKPEDLADNIGKEAAERLMGQQVSEIKKVPKLEWLRELTVTEGTHDYNIKAPDGRSINVGKGVVRDEAEAREYGFRYLNNKADEINKNRELAGERVGPTRELKGLELKIGGEGMKGFYDKILPATINKLVKKFGAKVEDAELHGAAEPTTANLRRSGQDAGIEHREDGTMRVYDTATDRTLGEFAPDQYDQASKAANEYRLPAQPVHAIDITPELRKAATEEGFPLFQGQPGGDLRGRITLGDNKAIIDLFAHADHSTFMHETGHLWLDEMARDADRPNAPAQVREDMATVLKWLGAERADAITVEQHEKWATGFEQYLASGKAPSPGLAGVFAQFKDWLTKLYRSLTSLGEPISPEIRAVMDRLVATPEQLGEKAEGRNVLPGPRPAKGPRARDPQTFSLLEFLASRGGIRADDPLIGDVRGSFGTKNKFVPGFGNLVRKPRELSTAERMGGGHAPMTLDQAREAAVEAGYLRDEGADRGGESTTTVNTLLEAIDRETRGDRVYREGREREAEIDPDEQRHRIESAAHDALRDEGIDPAHVPDKTMARVVEIMEREGERDPLQAYERAVMEETHYGAEAETGQQERIPDHIPGWDVPHDAGAAPAPGRPAEGLGRPGAGEAARDAGAGDRGAPGAAGRDAAGGDRAGVKPDWQRVADAKRPPDEDLAEASRAAEHAPEPESISTDPGKVVSAAERAAAEADKLLEDILPTLSEEERAMFKEALDALEHDKTQREQIVREGAACLLAATA